MIVDQEDFNPLIGKSYHTCMLSEDQMKKIYNLAAIRDRTVVGMQWLEHTQEVKLLMGNFATITIPKCMFPDYLPLDHPRISDYGFQTSFGDYKIDIKKILLF